MAENPEKDKKDECVMHRAGSKGDPNLCCCFIIDSDGRFEDPCYHAVADCR
ncbi:MAG: hypothetical protein WB792_12275 [Desulfobacterales bacterium]